MRAAFYCDPYLSRFMDDLIQNSDKPFKYCPEKHLELLKQNTIIQRVKDLVKALFYEIKSCFNFQFKNKLEVASFKINQKVSSLKKSNSTGFVDDSQVIPTEKESKSSITKGISENSLRKSNSQNFNKKDVKSLAETANEESVNLRTETSKNNVQKALIDKELPLNAMVNDVEKKMGKEFATFWQAFLGKLDSTNLESWNGQTLKLKSPLVCRIQVENEPEVLHNCILLLLGAHKSKKTKTIQISFSKEERVVDNNLKTIYSMVFDSGFYSFVHENVTPFKTYQYPKITRIDYLDDKNIFIKAARKTFFSNIDGGERKRTLSEIKKDWVTNMTIVKDCSFDKKSLITHVEQNGKNEEVK